jgi:hypothetical protein
VAEVAGFGAEVGDEAVDRRGAAAAGGGGGEDASRRGVVGVEPEHGDVGRHRADGQGRDEGDPEAGGDASYVECADTPHAFLNFPGALSAAWRAIGDIADDLTEFLGATTGR